MNLFKKNLTRWIPLGTFRFSSNDHIVFVRGNNKTGMLYFKTKIVNGTSIFGHLNKNLIPSDLIDVKAQWDKIQQMTNG